MNTIQVNLKDLFKTCLIVKIAGLPNFIEEKLFLEIQSCVIKNWNHEEVKRTFRCFCIPALICKLMFQSWANFSIRWTFETTLEETKKFIEKTLYA